MLKEDRCPFLYIPFDIFENISTNEKHYLEILFYKVTAPFAALTSQKVVLIGSIRFLSQSIPLSKCPTDTKIIFVTDKQASDVQADNRIGFLLTSLMLKVALYDKKTKKLHL